MRVPACLLHVIKKPPESGELCKEITEFVVAKDNLSQQGEGDLPPSSQIHSLKPYVLQWSSVTSQ